MKFTGEKYYLSEDNRIFIQEVLDGTSWGWYFWYAGRFRMCAKTPSADGLKEVSKECFDAVYFAERL